MHPSSVELYKFMADLSSRLMKKSNERIAEAAKLFDAHDELKGLVNSGIGLALAEVANAIINEAYAHAKSTNQIETLIGKFENKDDNRTP